MHQGLVRVKWPSGGRANLEDIAFSRGLGILFKLAEHLAEGVLFPLQLTRTTGPNKVAHRFTTGSCGGGACYLCPDCAVSRKPEKVRGTSNVQRWLLRRRMAWLD
jgi:hypothetical protein